MDEYLMQRAVALLDLLESDFGQSGRDVRLLAIRDELAVAWDMGKRAHSASEKP